MINTYIFRIEFQAFARNFFSRNSEKHLAIYPGKGWVYFMGHPSPEPEDLGFRWNSGGRVAIEAESIEEALDRFLEYLSHGHVPEDFDPCTFIDSEILEENRAQKKILEGHPLSKEEFNRENWPIKISCIEIFYKYGCMLKRDGTIFCQRWLEEDHIKVDKIAELCLITSFETELYWLASDFEEDDHCVIDYDRTKEIDTEYPFLVYNYTSRDF